MGLQKTAGNSITSRQQQAIRALLGSPTVRQAATAAGVGERTLHTWLEDQTFRAALNRAQAEALEAASRQLAGSLTAAVNRLQCLVGDPDAGPGIQLQAAKAILDQMFKLKEALDFETRLSALEAKQNER